MVKTWCSGLGSEFSLVTPQRQKERTEYTKLSFVLRACAPPPSCIIEGGAMGGVGGRTGGSDEIIL